MKNTVRMYCYFLFMFLISKCNGNLNLPTNTIQIPSNRIYNNFIRSEKYYIKQQLPHVFLIQGPSETFVKVPGLTMRFYHTEPLLYKIKFEGKYKFLPNTANRYQYNAGYSSNDHIDNIGGVYWLNNSPLITQCSFSDIIYLNPGLHVVDVAVRGTLDSRAFPTQVFGGALTIELVGYDLNAVIGMKPINANLT
ncbi:unnamed protein product [Adineta steineri]|uniref:Uncharacterized protein n=1 Tax=Adineta steineri TaxID=433720 RepID=A0A813Y4Q0_9BILA|nr:unnamed protein product [Adineta steineri]CAF1049350.1 unnamed protein product [Adineta steineri]CAF3632877.1 unnamed protein product [Adineta steineri]